MVKEEPADDAAFSCLLEGWYACNIQTGYIGLLSYATIHGPINGRQDTSVKNRN
jgi:hypothetical protein